MVCGEQLDGELRAVLAATMNEGQERDGRGTAGTPEVVIVEELCAHPERVSLFWGRSRPTSLVALGCTHAGASDAVHEAVRCGLDAAHGAAMSLAPALTQDTPDARHRLLAATCHAGSRRARFLIDRPRAARLPWQSGQALGRRMLLGDLRGAPSPSATVDGERCLGPERCGRCLSDCPAGAIRLEHAVPRVDPRACVSCGRCVTTCPTGALSMPGADVEGLGAEIGAYVEAGIDELDVICEHEAMSGSLPDPARHGLRAVVTVPCIAMLGPGARFGLSATGARLRVGACAECRCREVVASDARFVDRLLSVVDGFDARDQSATRPGESRDVLPWREPAATASGIAALLVRADPPGVTDPMLDEGALTHVVHVDSTRCTVCGSCALACPCGAVHADTGRHVLSVDSTQCIGCGQCTAVCPEQAIEVQRGVDLDAVAHGLRPVVASRDEETCTRCGTTYVVDPIVTSVQRRLAAKGKSPELIASLRHCPTCSGMVA